MMLLLTRPMAKRERDLGGFKVELGERDLLLLVMHFDDGDKCIKAGEWAKAVECFTQVGRFAWKWLASMETSIVSPRR